jgi:hypothetical protein
MNNLKNTIGNGGSRGQSHFCRSRAASWSVTWWGVSGNHLSEPCSWWVPKYQKIDPWMLTLDSYRYSTWDLWSCSPDVPQSQIPSDRAWSQEGTSRNGGQNQLCAREFV